MKSLMTLQDVHLANKRVLIREDFNVPMLNGVIQSDMRIRAAVPGILQCLRAGARVQLMSHLGRPKSAEYDAEFSLRPVAQYLEEILGIKVEFVSDWFVYDTSDADLVLYENVRFLPGEEQNSVELAQKMADLCDIFVMDAFASAHRAHASTEGVACFAPVSVAGPLVVAEVEALNRVMVASARPVVAIIGGAKVSSKIEVLRSMMQRVEQLLIGGGMANTFLVAKGYSLGASLVEEQNVVLARQFLVDAKEFGCEVILPIDVVLESGVECAVDQVSANERVMDIGERTRQLFAQYIESAATVLWNGPMGVFEDLRFAKGTVSVALAVAESEAYSVVGGGDTIAALEQVGVIDKIAYVSTAGGAFLEYIEGKQLPGLECLYRRGNDVVKTN